MRKQLIVSMRFLFILFLASFGFDNLRCEPLAQPNDGAYASRAEAFVDDLAASRFEAAFASFDAKLKAALPEEKLAGVWRQIQTQAGPYQERSAGRLAKIGGLVVVFVPCRFEKVSLDAKIAFGKDGQVAGLFFVPGKATSPEVTPPASVKETPIVVGAGKWALPGLLCEPASPSASPRVALVLVHGSGPHDRDETIGPNKPFRDLAWGLAARGVVVLRYDKRTLAHRKDLVADKSLTVDEEVVEDALEAVKRLRETQGVDPRRVFLLGHSLGGMLAPRIAERCRELTGVVVLAGATRRLEDAIVEQHYYLASLGGPLSEEQKKSLALLKDQALRVKALSSADADPGAPLLGIPSPYWLSLQGYDPVATAARLSLPMLILQGERDYQVTPVEYETWKRGLAGRDAVRFRIFPKLNHLFMSGEGPASPRDYSRPGHVDVAVIEEIALWLESTAGDR